MKNDGGSDSGSKNRWENIDLFEAVFTWKMETFVFAEKVKNQEQLQGLCPAQVKAREECEKIKFQMSFF